MSDAASAPPSGEAAAAEGGGGAEDGGFGLIGMRRYPEGFFSGIEWSTPQVYRKVCDRLDLYFEQWGRLPLLWDVDRPFDLLRYEVLGEG